MTKLLKATAAIVLYKSKTLKDGTHPVTLRVTFARQLKYYTLGRCHVESWNKEANRYKKDKEANIK